MARLYYYIVETNRGIVKAEVKTLYLEQDKFIYFEKNNGLDTHHIIQSKEPFEIGETYYTNSYRGVLRYNDYLVNYLDEDIKEIKEKIIKLD